MAQALPSATDCCSPCSICAPNTLIIVSGSGVGQIGFFTVNSVQAARAVPYATTNYQLSVNGNLTGGDGITFGIYDWDQLLTDPDDGADVINPSGNVLAGRWKRQV